MKQVVYSDVLYRAAELAGRARDKLPLSEARMMQGYFAADLAEVWNKEAWPELVPDPVAMSPVNRQFPKNEGAGPGLTMTGTVGSIDGLVATFTTAAPHNQTIGNIASATITGASTFLFFNGSFVITYTGASAFTYSVTGGSVAADSGLSAVVGPELGDILGVTTANPLITTRYRDVGVEEGNGYIKIDEGLAQVWVEYVLPRPDLMSIPDANLMAYLLPQRFSNYLAMRAAGLLLNADNQAGSGGVWLGLAERALTAELTRVGDLIPARRKTARVQRFTTGTHISL